MKTPGIPATPAFTLEGGAAQAGNILLLCIGLSFGVQAALLGSPILTMHIFDGVLQSRNGDTLLALSIGFGVVILMGGWLRYLRALLMATATDQIGQRLQLQAVQASLRGAVMGESTLGFAALGDAAEVRRLLGGSVASDMLDLLSAPAALAFLFALHPYYGWLALGGCVLLGVLGALADRTTRAMVRSASGELARSNAALSSRLRGRDMIEGLGMLPDILRVWRPQSAAALDLADAGQRRASAIQGLAHLLALLLQMGMVVLGAWLVSAHEASPGSLLAATMLAGMATTPVSRVVGTWRDWAFAVVAWQRLAGFIAQTAPPDPLPLDDHAPSGLHISNLTVRTADGSRLLVQDLDLLVAPGSVLGLRGPNGVGKSSLLRVLLGIVPASAGHVLLDGENLAAPCRQDGRASLGTRIGYQPQGAQLLNGSVLDNIRRFADGQADLAVTAARHVGAHDAIGRLPLGYETPAGPAGGLSGGQRQLVALARAFFGDPRLLVLDEPEAGLDAASIAQLRAAVARARAAGTVVLLVTHDPAGWEGVVTNWLDLAQDGNWRTVLAGHGEQAE